MHRQPAVLGASDRELDHAVDWRHFDGLIHMRSGVGELHPAVVDGRLDVAAVIDLRYFADFNAQLNAIGPRK